MGVRVYATLDAEHNLSSVFGVLFQVVFQEHKAVVVRWAVELTAIPKVA